VTSFVSGLTAWAKPSYWPWTDRLGRFSALKTIVFAGLFVPGIWIIAQYEAGWLGPRLLNEMIHQTGDWTVRFIILSLAVTPLRHAGQWPKLISIRRMIGLAALFYGLWHFSLYSIDQQFDPVRIAREIILRIYLTIGFAALLGLIALGATSTDGMIRRMGALAWGRLHKIVHAIAVLAVLHFFMQSKIDVFQATLMLGCLVYLEGCRLLVWRRIKLGFIALSGLAVVSGLLTAGLEAGWYAAATKVHAILVLQANLALKMGLRPAWWILIAGLAFAVLGGVRHWRKQAPAKRLKEARA
jgi:sulfoxide reductase heme-binding subunit YedZ